jgi:hypothetical protein
VRLIIRLLIPAMLGAGLPAQGIVEIGATKDNTLFWSSTGNLSSGIGNSIYCGVNAMGRPRRGVVRFSVASSVPPGATIVSATLRLQMTMTAGPALDIELHRLLGDWGEGNSFSPGGSGSTAQAGDCTWIHRVYPSIFWATQGGDFAATVSATTSVAGNGTYTWTSAQLAADVQDMLVNPAADFGWILKSPEVVSGDAKQFSSREDPTAGVQPKLIVSYLAPPSASVTNLGFGCNGIQLAATGLPQVGNGAFALTISGAAPGSAAYVFVASGLASTPLQLGGGCVLALDYASALSNFNGGLYLGPVTTGSSGQVAFPAPVPPFGYLHGLAVHVQGITIASGFAGSNALRLVVGS